MKNGNFHYLAPRQTGASEREESFLLLFRTCSPFSALLFRRAPMFDDEDDDMVRERPCHQVPIGLPREEKKVKERGSSSGATSSC